MTDTARSLTLQAYDRVILRVKSMRAEQHGDTHGAMSWFAAQLGTSRQTVDNWGKRAGIPPAYVDKVAKITGLSKDEVRPDTILVEVSRKDWVILSKTSSKDLIARMTVHNIRRKYG